jgi:hypothetical protein
MKTTRPLIVLALLSGLATGLVACGNTATVTGSGGLSSTSGGPSALVSGAPSIAAAPTTTKSGHSGGGTATSGSTSSSPSAPPSSPGRTIKTIGPLRGNYAIGIRGACYEKIYNDGGNKLLFIGADFSISHTGLLLPAPVPFKMTNSVDLDNSSGSEPVGIPFSSYVGSMLAASSDYLGKTVKLTGTISPTGSDTNPGDNSISISVEVPATPPPLTSFDPVPLTCL